MHISLFASILLTLLINHVTCTCPVGTTACGTACCDTGIPGEIQLIGTYCADASKSLCCSTNDEVEANGICCRKGEFNCGGTCCGGNCVALKKRSPFKVEPFPPFRVDVCFYETDQQCQNIGAEAVCKDGACSPLDTCEAGCCFRTSIPRE
jgi:hypothetical protein